MATESEPLEIEITEEPVATDPEIVIEHVEKTPEPKAEPIVTVDEGLTKLQEQLANERKARTEAERKANEAAQNAHKFRSEAQDSNLHLITNAIETVKQNNEILKANYRAARESGDIDSEADIQMEMSANAAKLMQLEQGKQALEVAPKEEAPSPYAADPVEALASQLSSRSADWVRAHPEFATNQNQFNKMLAAHNLAVADGIEPDSPEYFESVETTLRIRQQPQAEYQEPTHEAAQVTQRRTAPPAAPVSRSSGPPGTKPNRVTLSADEREIASMMGMSDQEYARSKLALIKEGKLH